MEFFAWVWLGLSVAWMYFSGGEISEFEKAIYSLIVGIFFMVATINRRADKKK